MGVLILVLVEDGLREQSLFYLNNVLKVLILVLVEDGLREKVVIVQEVSQDGVLILVLVEDGLRGFLKLLE